MTLSKTQLELIPYLLSEKNVEMACTKADICKNLYYKWIKTEAFKNELALQRDIIYKQSLYRIKLLSESAIAIYGDLASSSTESIRLKVADSIFKNCVMIVENEKLEKRLLVLEEQVEGSKR